MVLTQSCDLVRHDGLPCKSRYVTLAAVRSLDTVLSRELARHQRSSIETTGGLCCINKRRWVEDFLVKLINNNNSEYFYLAEDIDCGLSEPSVAFLKLSVPLKSEHYDKCLAARVAQLTEVFQAKLGWLVGNMYSRVGTPDWVPTRATEDEFSELIETLLRDMCIWVDESVLSRIRKEQKDRRRAEGPDYVMPQNEIIRLVAEYAREQETKTERNIGILVERIQQAIPTLDPAELDALRTCMKTSTQRMV
jgi:hypothetical protein